MHIHRPSFMKFFVFLNKIDCFHQIVETQVWCAHGTKLNLVWCEMCHISSWIVKILHRPFKKIKFYECKSLRKLWKCKQAPECLLLYVWNTDLLIHEVLYFLIFDVQFATYKHNCTHIEFGNIRNYFTTKPCD